jgi:hypothetical protein
MFEWVDLLYCFKRGSVLLAFIKLILEGAIWKLSVMGYYLIYKVL